MSAPPAPPAPPASPVSRLVDWPKWRRRYWAAVYFARRMAMLALMLWCALASLGALSGPHPVAAGVGLVCAVIVLCVQGAWVWRRYRRWVQ